jgi:hypothetical protein
MDDREWLAERFGDDRPRLRAVAYRTLASITDAEDAVQDTWERVNRAGSDEVENLSPRPLSAPGGEPRTHDGKQALRIVERDAVPGFRDDSQVGVGVLGKHPLRGLGGEHVAVVSPY